MNKISKAIITIIFLTSGINAAVAENGIKITSPDKQLSVLVSVTAEGRLSYSVKSGGIPVLETSPLGITVDDVDLGKGARFTSKPIFSQIDETYPLLGNHATAHNFAKEVAIPVVTSGKAFQLIVRVYNDGVGIRYTIPADSKRLNGESTSWNLPANTTKVAWSGFSQCYEELSYATALDKVPQDKPVMGPITIEVAGRYLSISEADCETFSDMAFVRNGNTFKANFPCEKLGWDIKRRTDNGSSVLAGTYRG